MAQVQLYVCLLLVSLCVCVFVHISVIITWYYIIVRVQEQIFPYQLFAKTSFAAEVQKRGGNLQTELVPIVPCTSRRHNSDQSLLDTVESYGQTDKGTYTEEGKYRQYIF
jgi:hypothetical protein